MNQLWTRCSIPEFRLRRENNLYLLRSNTSSPVHSMCVSLKPHYHLIWKLMSRTFTQVSSVTSVISMRPRKVICSSMLELSMVVTSTPAPNVTTKLHRKQICSDTLTQFTREFDIIVNIAATQPLEKIIWADMWNRVTAMQSQHLNWSCFIITESFTWASFILWLIFTFTI